MYVESACAETTRLVFNVTAKQNQQKISFAYSEGVISETRDIMAEMGRWINAEWISFRRYTRNLYDLLKASLLHLTLLYG